MFPGAKDGRGDRREPYRYLSHRIYRAGLNLIETLAQRCGRAPKQNHTEAVGRRGEDLAYWFLRRQGYTIVARNYRRPPLRGEIDLIAWEGGILVFVEVKTRSGEGLYAPEQAVHREKRRHLIQVARWYRRRRGLRNRFRFDVVAIRHADQPQAEIVLHRDAFREEED